MSGQMRNVFMASFAFFVPIKRIKRKYRCASIDKTKLQTPFIYYPNAICRYWKLSNSCIWQLHQNMRFYFKSRYDGVNEIWREVEVKPYLLEFELGKQDGKFNFLVLLVSIDKIFGQCDYEYQHIDICTEYDLVNLKKAFFERGKCGLFSEKDEIKGMHHLKWLELLLAEIEGRKRKDIKLSYSIIDICVEKLELKDNDTFDNLVNQFSEAYYQVPMSETIDDFLGCPIEMDIPCAENQKVSVINVDERYFVYGLMYANDNFMMLHESAVNSVVEKCYSNNKVEKYWADDESILHVKTHTPYAYVSDKRKSVSSGGLDSVRCITEMCMLIYLKRKLLKFRGIHNKLDSRQMDAEQSKIAVYFYDKLFNQTEMDKKMDYFMTQFRLQEMFDKIINVTTPKKNALEIFFNRKMAFMTVLLAIITIVVTIIIGLLNR